MHIIQDILIVLLAGYMTIDQNGPVVMSWFSVIVGTISGLIMGKILRERTQIIKHKDKPSVKD